MKVRKAFRFLLPCLLAMLWSSAAIASPQPDPNQSFQPHAKTSLVAALASNGESDQDNPDEASPDAILPKYSLPGIIKVAISLCPDARLIPLSNSASGVPLRGPPTVL